MPLSLAVSIAVFVVIALRQWLPDWVRIWQVMTAGAFMVLAGGAISPKEAVAAIDWNVIAYLAGVFLISHALLVSGFSERLSHRICRGHTGVIAVLGMYMLLVAGISAILTNDASAAIGAPIAIVLARQLNTDPRLVLLALCATVTIGSLVSPVGNPQNLLIAAHANMANPVATFFLWFAVPASLSLLVTLVWFAHRIRKTSSEPAVWQLPRAPGERQWPALVSTTLLGVLVLAHSLAPTGTFFKSLPLGALSLVATTPLLVISRRRWIFLRDLDWPTLIFFAAMFIVTGAILKSHVLQDWLNPWQSQLGTPPLLSLITFWGSQLFSNVPFVEIYLNLLEHSPTETLMLLSGISTLAGNLFIISAASNVIILQQAEKIGVQPIRFWQFTITLLPVTLFSLFLCYGWIAVLGHF